jgi:hypothetical protein
MMSFVGIIHYQSKHLFLAVFVCMVPFLISLLQIGALATQYPFGFTMFFPLPSAVLSGVLLAVLTALITRRLLFSPVSPLLRTARVPFSVLVGITVFDLLAWALLVSLASLAGAFVLSVPRIQFPTIALATGGSVGLVIVSVAVGFIVGLFDVPYPVTAGVAGASTATMAIALQADAWFYILESRVGWESGGRVLGSVSSTIQRLPEIWRVSTLPLPAASPYEEVTSFLSRWVLWKLLLSVFFIAFTITVISFVRVQASRKWRPDRVIYPALFAGAFALTAWKVSSSILPRFNRLMPTLPRWEFCPAADSQSGPITETVQVKVHLDAEDSARVITAFRLSFAEGDLVGLPTQKAWRVCFRGPALAQVPTVQVASDEPRPIPEGSQRWWVEVARLPADVVFSYRFPRLTLSGDGSFNSPPLASHGAPLLVAGRAMGLSGPRFTLKSGPDTYAFVLPPDFHKGDRPKSNAVTSVYGLPRNYVCHQRRSEGPAVIHRAQDPADSVEIAGDPTNLKCVPIAYSITSARFALYTDSVSALFLPHDLAETSLNSATAYLHDTCPTLPDRQMAILLDGSMAPQLESIRSPELKVIFLGSHFVSQYATSANTEWLREVAVSTPIRGLRHYDRTNLLLWVARAAVFDFLSHTTGGDTRSRNTVIDALYPESAVRLRAYESLGQYLGRKGCFEDRLCGIVSGEFRPPNHAISSADLENFLYVGAGL